MARVAAPLVVPPPFSGKVEGSFAYKTIKDRLPVILTKAIDSLHRERHSIAKLYGENAQEETKEVIGRLSGLRNEMVTNKPIVVLKGEGHDIPLWNAYLEKQLQLYGFEPAWFDSPWLYSECYLYRRIKEAFELSSMLQNYDPFRSQKKSSFSSALEDAALMCTVLQESLDKVLGSEDTPVIYEEFVKFVEASLWGNQCDLSISAGKTDVVKTSSLSVLDDLRANIIVNEIETLWNMLQLANCKHCNAVRIDIVLDNAGYELLVDLCLLEFLNATNLITEAHLYVKAMPWFVSDTVYSDIDWLLNLMCSGSKEVLVHFGKKWRSKILKGTWLIKEEMFWTLPHDYSEMEETDPNLYKKLGSSDIVIFKGDLNYRKLTSDRNWDPTTPFVSALCGFLPAPLCSLRTIKADVLTGLKPGVKEELDKNNPGWQYTGNFALIQCVPKDN